MLLRVIKPLLIAWLAACLCQCTHVINQARHTPVNGASALASPYTMPANAYLAMAKNQSADERQALLIMAAGRYIYDGEWREGLAILSKIGTLTEILADEKSILLAKIDLMRDQPQQAIRNLSAVHHIGDLPSYYRAQYHEMLASAYQTTGNIVESIAERIKLDSFLPDDTAKSNNRRALWFSLTKLPKEELAALSAEAQTGSILKGWFDLAELARSTHDDPEQLLAQIKRWQTQYPAHAANSILPQPLSAIKNQLITPPQRIALLLPLTGPLAGPGRAIKDGFMAASDASPRAKYTTIRVYDTNSANILSLYQQALEDNAEFVIGPLSKADVAKVAASNHPVTTLLLNDLDRRTQDNAYQFGLSPNTEARQVAVRAHKYGYSRVLVIAPSGTWGDDVLASFANQWRSQGGQIVDSLRYGAEDDLTTRMREFLHINVRDMRRKPTKKSAGESHLASVPPHRQDFDVIFLLAYPAKARQIVPLLKYYYVGDIPVYATSAVYAGNLDRQKDRDLDGVIFCDMPWVFNHQTYHNPYWPEQLNSYNRLYALGLDSYALTSQLNQLLLFPALGVHDQTGVLYMTPLHQIARISQWGQFRQGVVQPMYENYR